MTATAAHATKTPAASPQRKFVAMRADMAAGLIERDEEIDLVLTALVANHHPLLVGEPGTAKSMLGRAVAGWLADDAGQFEVLLSKHTDPAELFGPVSISGLKTDEYRRITTGTLVESRIAFLDEIFKASPAILNTLLGVMNERKYRNGRTWMNCPLVMALAASNEWPQDSETGGKELGALFDRFLFRKLVKPIRSPEGVDRLLWEPKLEVAYSTRITPEEIAAARGEADALAFSDEAREGFMEVLAALEKEGIQPGDRRKRWSVGACRAFAYLAGGAAVEKDHLEILAHTLWVDPAEQPVKTAAVVAKIANPVGMIVNELLIEARALLKESNLRDLTEVAAAAKKLTEIVAKLKGLRANPKAVTAHKWVATKLTEMRARAINVEM